MSSSLYEPPVFGPKFMWDSKDQRVKCTKVYAAIQALVRCLTFTNGTLSLTLEHKGSGTR